MCNKGHLIAPIFKKNWSATEEEGEVKKYVWRQLWQPPWDTLPTCTYQQVILIKQHWLNYFILYFIFKMQSLKCSCTTKPKKLFHPCHARLLELLFVFLLKFRDLWEFGINGFSHVIKWRCPENDSRSSKKAGSRKEPKKETVKNHCNEFPVFNDLKTCKITN